MYITLRFFSMSLKLTKILRNISKGILFLTGLGLLGYVGYLTYLSVSYRPYKVRVTNLTDTSFTVSWVTDSPMKGVVYFKDSDSFLPGPLSFFGSKVAVDDRDFAKAQSKCVEDFNRDVAKDVGDDFVVSGDNFDCEDIKVEKYGKYYTHHVTLKNLESEKEYYFRVGDGYFSWRGDTVQSRTFYTLDEVKEPIPIFGKIVDEGGVVTEDSLVYVQFVNGRESKKSTIYSSVTNDQGGWYVDGSYTRTDAGKIVNIESGQDFFEAYGQYQNYDLTEKSEWVFGYFQGAYPDIVVKNVKSSSKGHLLFQSFAEGPANCPSCPSWMTADQVTAIQNGTMSKESIATGVGYGNAAKAIAAANGGNFSADDLPKIGLNINAGNLNAISGGGPGGGGAMTQDEFEKKRENKENIVINRSTGTWSAPTSASSVTVDKSLSLPVTFSNGEYQLGGADTLNLVGNDSAKNQYIQEKLKEAYDSCQNKNSCVISVEAIEVDLTPEVFLNTFSQQIKDCTGDCQLGPKVETMKAIVTGLVSDLDKQITEVKAVEMTQADYIIEGLPEKNALYYESLINTIPKWVVLANPGGTFIGSGETPIEMTLTQNSDGTFSMIPKGTPMLPGVEPLKLTEEQVADLVGGLVDKYNCTDACADLLTTQISGFEKVRTQEEILYELETKREELNDVLSNVQSLLLEIKGRQLITDLLGVVKSAYAEEVKTNELFFLPEYGTFTLEYGPFEYEKKVTNGQTIYIFYFELNGKKGIQLPKGEPKAGVLYDLLLESVPSQITYEQTASAKEVSLKKGINIISFDWLPAFSYEDIYTAKDFAKKVGGSTIEFIAYFEGGRWSKGISCDKENTCFGDDFALTPGRGYLVRSSENKEVMLPGFKITSEVPINFSAGWNLVGIHGYSKAFTAKTLIESVNNVEGLTADNVSWWPTSKGRYEGLQVNDGQEYGLDFPISPLNGYFIRINDFKPEAEECKSIIWQEGGDLNGKCGNNKTILN